jgi:hypothetical protein
MQRFSSSWTLRPLALVVMVDFLQRAPAARL